MSKKENKPADSQDLDERPLSRRVGRRNFLKTGTVLASLPVIMSLTANEARAQRSGGS